MAEEKGGEGGTALGQVLDKRVQLSSGMFWGEGACVTFIASLVCVPFLGGFWLLQISSRFRSWAGIFEVSCGRPEAPPPPSPGEAAIEGQDVSIRCHSSC